MSNKNVLAIANNEIKPINQIVVKVIPKPPTSNHIEGLITKYLGEKG